MYQNIPEELRNLNQWVVWKLEETDTGKPTKVPYDAKNGRKASTTDPFTWSSFETAMVAVATDYSGIGFVFTASDDYCGIDLDPTEQDVADGILTKEEAAVIYERQLTVFTNMDSYSELSPSGKGLHIIVKAQVKHGRRRSKIEVYSSGRFFTMTGNVYKNAPIAERQNIVDMLWQEMGNGTKVTTFEAGYNGSEKHSDADIIAKASNASNGEVFRLLHAGKWQDKYSSQSEAELAYFNILAFYTQNREQLTRIFRMSPLGVRDKAHRDAYVKYNIDKSFDMLLPPIDLDSLANAFQASIATKVGEGSITSLPKGIVTEIVNPQGPSRHNSAEQSPNSLFPPGLVGEIAEFILAQAPRPVPEIALVGAIGLASGIVGKAYNISGTGLNQYTMLLAATGTGKEAIASGISKLVSATKITVPSISEFIGPGQIASPQALAKYLQNNGCFVTVSGEIGIQMQQMASDKANPNLLGLKALLLDLYNKSGEGSILQGTIYSDKSNNTQSVHAPAFSWIGESTPETFYAALSENLIADGLLPRFNIIEYTGERPDMNYSAKSVVPSFQLIDKLGTLAARASELMANKKVVHVATTDEADALLRNFDKHADQMIRGSKEVIRHLWNRAHIKALKLAALVAVGIDPYSPVIDYSCALWSCTQIDKSVNALTKRFEAGDIGENSGELKQQNDLRKALGKYLANRDDEKFRDMRNSSVVSYHKILTSCANIASFKSDRMGAAFALKRTIQVFIDSGELQECGADVKQKFKMQTAKLYAVLRPADCLGCLGDG